jgi:hypothetical protein
MCCSVLQCLAVCYSVLHYVAVCCNVLQCVAAVCCSVLQCEQHVPLSQVTWRIHMRDMSWLCAAHLTCRWCVTWHATWLIHICDMILSCAWHDSSTSCSDMTHWYEYHDSLICVRWLIDMCEMTHWYVWHDSFITQVQSCDRGWRGPIGCLMFIVHFLQKSPRISVSFAERDLQHKASYASLLPCIWDRTLHTCL